MTKTEFIQNDNNLAITYYHASRLMHKTIPPSTSSASRYCPMDTRYSAIRLPRTSATAREIAEDEAPRYWLTGKLFCGECGSSMQSVSGTKKTIARCLTRH